MARLHIVQAGIDNGDKALIERAARLDLSTQAWVAPKAAEIGDDVVIYIARYGFFATARVRSPAKPRADWANRYGAGLEQIRLIQPPISLTTIRSRLPRLTWAIYPRSITTTTAAVARQIQRLIQQRRVKGTLDLDGNGLASASIEDLRKAALLKARASAPRKVRKTVYRIRSQAIHLYVLRRANGYCEGCGAAAPFRKPDGSDYLEPHHTTRLSDEGPDHPARVIALCPNCHRRAHYAEAAETFNAMLIKKLRALEPV
jgi:hypothetical protein